MKRMMLLVIFITLIMTRPLAAFDDLNLGSDSDMPKCFMIQREDAYESSNLTADLNVRFLTSIKIEENLYRAIVKTDQDENNSLVVEEIRTLDSSKGSLRVCLWPLPSVQGAEAFFKGPTKEKFSNIQWKDTILLFNYQNYKCSIDGLQSEKPVVSCGQK